MLHSIPETVIPGMTFVSHAWIDDWDPFYQDMIRAFANLNVLAHGIPLEKQLPKNLWACQENRIIEVANLPLINGMIDYCKLQEISRAQGSRQSIFLLASVLQNKFKSFFHFPVSDRDLQLEPIKKIKTILYTSSWKQPTLMKWEVVLQILPLSATDMSLVFKRLVQKIKISKLRDCNFKILHRILATPSLIAKVRKNPNMVSCIWCGGYANLNHILIKCLVT